MELALVDSRLSFDRPELTIKAVDRVVALSNSPSTLSSELLDTVVTAQGE